ncbi:MAG: hypothetical protein SGI88_20475 [Candidatus Hydrogenedentes bacterium]|nr:hypothetical protein [Candidatus Hydrogenedentota bacterium]
MALSRRDTVAAIIIVMGFIVLMTTLYFSLKPAGPDVGFDNNFFVQQRIRVQNQSK